MTDVYNTYQGVLDKINKEENGYLTIDVFNRLLQVGSRFVYNDYQARLQNPNTAAVEKAKLQDRLFPFIKRSDIPVVAGYAATPTDYAYFSAAKAYFDNGDSLIQLNALYSKLCLAEEDPSIDLQEIKDEIDAIIKNPKLVGVQLLDNEQIAKRLNSYIPGKRPSMRKPVCEREGGRFHVIPENEGSLFLWYYCRPKLAKLVMIQTPTLELDYDQINSVQIEWGDEAMNDITNKIANDFAIYVRENALWEMQQAEKQKAG